MKKSILETTKYPFKPIEFDDKNLQVIDDLYKGLYRKRQLAYGGLLKQIKKELELDDIENGDLIHVDEETEKSLKEQNNCCMGLAKKNYFVK